MLTRMIVKSYVFHLIVLISRRTKLSIRKCEGGTGMGTCPECGTGIEGLDHQVSNVHAYIPVLQSRRESSKEEFVGMTRTGRRLYFGRNVIWFITE